MRLLILLFLLLTLPVLSASPNGLSVVYEKPSDPAHEEVYRILRNTRVFDQIAREVNATLVIPCPLPVRFTECQEENAFYDPNEREISMCYELVEKYRFIFTDESSPPEEVETEVVNAALFTFYHELGHALVDLYDLPITGGEEDAVDEFAAVTLVNLGDAASEDALLAAVEQFAVDAEEASEDVQDLEELPYWGVHSLDMVRFYNLLCVIYGSDPDRYADLVTEGTLPEDRAGGCEEEYERKSRVWDQLLAPHLKKR